MRTLPAILASLGLLLVVPVSRADAGETATAAVRVEVHIAARTSLKVSSQVLLFNVLEPGGAATASIDFGAAARVAAGDDVVLTVERLSDAEMPGDAADVEPMVTFAGEGAGVVAGTIRCDTPAIAGRWRGSGKREGRLVFRMQAPAAGNYSVPVRFVLSIP
jgi:hypothetical protein